MKEEEKEKIEREKRANAVGVVTYKGEYMVYGIWFEADIRSERERNGSREE